jgi:hypothetical protein
MNDTSHEPLRLLLTTQSTGLKLFWRLHRALGSRSQIGDCGFFVTNRYEYNVFDKEVPAFEAGGFDVLKEWELLDHAKAMSQPDIDAITSKEIEFGDVSFWNALIIDRRLGYKLKAQFKQSYEPPYSHEQLLKIIQVALKHIEDQFDRIKPHAVLGLNAVTLYDYIYYLIAKKRDIPYLQLKLTRIRNYVTWFSDPFQVSPHIVEAYRRYLSGETRAMANDGPWQDAVAFLAASQRANLVYEGAIKRPGAASAPAAANSTASGSRAKLVSKLAAWKARIIEGIKVRDDHYPTFLYSLLNLRVLKKVRRRFHQTRFDISDANAFVRSCPCDFALFPLNTEPEVALLAYGRPYRNQIETVRNLAAALPVGWKLVVKEHPNSFGYRTHGYYKKLKQIPNVLIASPQSDTAILTEHSRLVGLVYGTIGLEAIIKRKPVVVFSEAPYGVFGPTMVCFNRDPWRLGHDIRDLLDNYAHDERQVLAYIAAHLSAGVPVNLFTGLLAKSGRQSGDGSLSLDEQYDILARHTLSRISEETARLSIIRRQSDAHE